MRCLGAENFCGQIGFKKTTGAGSPAVTTDRLAGVFDYLLWYARDKEAVKYRPLYRKKELGGQAASQYVWLETSDGDTTRSNPNSHGDLDGRWFAHGDLTSQTGGSTTFSRSSLTARASRPPRAAGRQSKSGMATTRAARRLMAVGNTLRYVRYFDDYPLFPLTNLWEDTVN